MSLRACTKNQELSCLLACSPWPARMHGARVRPAACHWRHLPLQQPAAGAKRGRLGVLHADPHAARTSSSIVLRWSGSSRHFARRLRSFSNSSALGQVRLIRGLGPLGPCIRSHNLKYARSSRPDTTTSQPRALGGSKQQNPLILDYRALRWICFLDPPRALGSETPSGAGRPDSFREQPQENLSLRVARPVLPRLSGGGNIDRSILHAMVFGTPGMYPLYHIVKYHLMQ